MCNWEEYLDTLREITPWLLMYDQTKYVHWLLHFWAMLSDLPAEQTQLVRSNVPQSMTGKPYSSIPWDLWIEMTMENLSKMKAWWLSILRNEKQLMADTRNANNIVALFFMTKSIRTRNAKTTLNALRHECA